jgi:hypothetical protein
VSPVVVVDNHIKIWRNKEVGAAFVVFKHEYQDLAFGRASLASWLEASVS